MGLLTILTLTWILIGTVFKFRSTYNFAFDFDSNYNFDFNFDLGMGNKNKQNSDIVLDLTSITISTTVFTSMYISNLTVFRIDFNFGSDFTLTVITALALIRIVFKFGSTYNFDFDFN